MSVMRVEQGSALDMLASYAADHPNRCVFRRGADEFALDNLERICGIALDPDHRLFLARFDGGFINPFRDIVGSLTDEARNAVCFLGVNAIARSLALLRERYDDPQSWRFLPRWEAEPTAFRFVPIARLSNSEDLLVTAPGEGPRSVLNAGAGGPHQWGVAAGCFAEFLSSYVSNEGVPPVEAEEPNDAFARDRWG